MLSRLQYGFKVACERRAETVSSAWRADRNCSVRAELRFQTSCMDPMSDAASTTSTLNTAKEISSSINEKAARFFLFAALAEALPDSLRGNVLWQHMELKSAFIHAAWNGSESRSGINRENLACWIFYYLDDHFLK